LEAEAYLITGSRESCQTAIFRIGAALGFASAALVFAVPIDGGANLRAALAQDSEPEESKPTRHFKVDRPADLSHAAALTVYLRILDEMVSGYRMSGLSGAADYRSWRRYNKTPYRSATHGERYVNNYGNVAGKSYGEFEEAGTMRVGAVLAKDSFAVTNRGDVFLGPLFLMEKMAPGFNAETRDWRYSMIMPDGSLFGVTGGEGSKSVGFCATCHRAAGDENDHLFFVPQEHRAKIFSVEPAEQ